jgi:hypothetical protein
LPAVTNGWAGIVHVRHYEARVELGPDAYFSTLGHGLDGVADQVHKGALHAAALQRQFDLRGHFDGQRHAMRFGCRGQ